MEHKKFSILYEGDKECVFKYGDEIFSFINAVVIKSCDEIEFDRVVMIPDTQDNRQELFEKAGKRIR